MSPAKRGPRPGGADTRGDILEAAEQVFSEEGYDKGSIRGVARSAGVDPALVRHYFASKTELFVEAMRPRIDLDAQVERLAEGDPELVGERVMTFFVDVWDRPLVGARILQIMKAALSHPEVAQVVRKVIVEGVVEKVAARVGAAEPRLAAGMTVSQVFGVAMLRHAAKIEPLASMPAEELVARYAPVVTRLLRQGAVDSSAVDT